MAKVKFNSPVYIGPLGKQVAIQDMQLRGFSMNFQDSNNPTFTVLLQNGDFPHPVTLRGMEAFEILVRLREKFPDLEVFLLKAIETELPAGAIE